MKRRVTFGKGCVKIYQIGEKSSGQKTEDRSQETEDKSSGQKSGDRSQEFVCWALRAKGIVWTDGTRE
jgi:hypothetical protein